MHILVVNHVVPFPPVSGGDLRAYYLIKALATKHDVTVVGFNCGALVMPPSFPVRPLEFPYEMPRLWKEMYSGDPLVWRPAYEKLLNGTEEPWAVSCMQSAGMDELLRTVGRENPDLAIFHHTNMARYLPALPPDVPKILDLVDLHSLMSQRAAEGLAGSEGEEMRREAERTRRFERHAALRCRLCLAVSEAEAEAARRLLGIEHVRVVPNGVDTEAFAPADAAPTDGYLLFTGTMSYAPNVEGARYFAREVLPLVRREVPEARFHVVGAFPGEEVRALAADDVVVHGKVPSMAPYYHQAAVVVVPLLHGGGTRIKILEAAASGKAVVSTPLGAEGLDFRPGEDLVLADSAAAFAAAVAGLLRDPGRRRRLGESARRAARHYDWNDIGERYCRIAEEVARPGGGEAPLLGDGGRVAGARVAGHV